MNDNKELKTCYEKAVSYFGSKTKMALALQTSTQNIQNWGNKGVIPPNNALKVERLTNGVVKSREILIENDK